MIHLTRVLVFSLISYGLLTLNALIASTNPELLTLFHAIEAGGAIAFLYHLYETFNVTK